MGIITNYNQFINEGVNNENKDVFELLELLKKSKTEDLLSLRDSLKELSLKTENVNENFIINFIDKIKMKLKRAFDDRVWKYLINQKGEFYSEIAEKLNLFDLTSLDDIYEHFPNFKIEVIYLAGGMDKAADVGVGWRSVVENEFEKYPGRKTGLPEITIPKFDTVEPKRIVNDKYLDLFIENPSKAKKLFNFPLLLNPVRKELDRTKNEPFAAAMSIYKSYNWKTPPEEMEPQLKAIRKTFSSPIEPDDEHLVRLSDFIFLGLNRLAAAGTYGELEMASLMNTPVFVWMTDTDWMLGQTKEEKYGGFSPWTFPQMCKIARNEDEAKILISTIMKYVK